jgi:DnaJ-class molecular chaperone
LKWHPDRNKDNYDQAREMFADISNAYDTLSDPAKRNAYNRGGVKGVQDHEQSSQHQGTMFRDMFGMLIKFKFKSYT